MLKAALGTGCVERVLSSGCVRKRSSHVRTMSLGAGGMCVGDAGLALCLSTVWDI